MSREMRDSDIEWIGQIPEHWEVSRIKNIATGFSNGTSVTQLADEDSQYAVTRIETISTGKINYDKVGYVPFFEGINKYLLVKGDILISNINSLERVGNSAMYMGEQTLYHGMNLLRVHTNERMFATYLHYYLRSKAFLEQMKSCCNHAINQVSVSSSTLKNLYIALPNLSEQQAIADYLDEKCAEVDEMIALQEQIIEELKAYKQSVITEAVTKGLNPNAPMRDSGVVCIGEIPSHWEVHPFKAYYKTTKGLNITKENLVESGVPVISYGQIHSKLNTGTSISNELIRYVPETYLDSNPECLSKKFDMFFADTSEDREGAGNVAFIDIDTPIFAGYHTIIARPNDEIKTKYLAYLTKTDAWRTQIRNSISGVKVFSISQKLINRAYIIIPSLTEQRAIADYLDEKCADIDSLIQTKQSKIDSLKEYKKSIIYEYVTGKREV